MRICIPPRHAAPTLGLQLGTRPVDEGDRYRKDEQGAHRRGVTAAVAALRFEQDRWRVVASLALPPRTKGTVPWHRWPFPKSHLGPPRPSQGNPAIAMHGYEHCACARVGVLVSGLLFGLGASVTSDAR